MPFVGKLCIFDFKKVYYVYITTYLGVSGKSAYWSEAQGSGFEKEDQQPGADMIGRSMETPCCDQLCIGV
jgi:hypothetical protein